MFSSPSREQKVADLESNGVLLVSKVFVGGLAEQTQEEDLKTLFADIAPTKSVQIISDRSRNEIRRYAFIEFETQEEVKKIIGQFKTNPVELHGRKLIIHQAYKRPPTNYRKMFPTVMVPWNYCFPPYYGAPAMANMAMGPTSPYMMVPTTPVSSPSYNDYRGNMHGHANGMTGLMSPHLNTTPSLLTCYTPPMSPYHMPNNRSQVTSAATLEHLAQQLSSLGLEQDTGINGLNNENMYRESAVHSGVNGHMGAGSWKGMPEMTHFNESTKINTATYPRGFSGYY